MATFLEIASDLSGESFTSGSLLIDPLSLEGFVQGNATVIGELSEGTIFNTDVQFLLGIAYLTGDGGATDALVEIIPIAAELQGNESLIGDGLVVDAAIEEPPVPPNSPCDVEYDTEICHIDFING